MGDLKTVGKDTKNLILGNDGSENEPEDFKVELSKSIKKGEITKADGTVLITARDDVEKLRKKIEKNQIDDIQSIANRETYDTPEEEQEAIKKKQEKEREKERRRKQRENEAAIKMNENSNKKAVRQPKEEEKEKAKEKSED